MAEKPDLKQMRVLIVGGKPHAIRLLRTVLNLAGIVDIVYAAEAVIALTFLKSQMFDAVFCDEQVEAVNGVAFAVAARREPDVWDHMIPIFLTCSAARRKQVEAARDIGVTDVLGRPISAATIIRKLTIALVKPRSFIAAPTFFGPDRRAKVRPAYAGDDRRIRKARKVSVALPVGKTEYI